MSHNTMILNLFFFNPQGDYRFSWRHQDAPEHGIFTLNYYTALARKAEAANFGLDQIPQHGNRYQRAGEFIDVVTHLWDSWEDGALLFDKPHGLFADADKVHHLNHRGDFFKVRGPLNVPRPPQGHPVLVQAGSSEAGKQLAASRADMHFVFIKSIKQGKAYREEMNQRLNVLGRSPEYFKIIAGVLPVVVISDAEKAERQQLNAQLMSDRMAVGLLSAYLKLDLSLYSYNKPLPDEASFDGIRTVLHLIRDYDPALTILELGRLLLQSSDSWLVIRSAQEVADTLAEIYLSGATDGFNLMFPLLPGDFDRFTEQVVPILKAKGVMKVEYAPGTLREKLGLPLARNHFA